MRGGARGRGLGSSPLCGETREAHLLARGALGVGGGLVDPRGLLHAPRLELVVEHLEVGALLRVHASLDLLLVPLLHLRLLAQLRLARRLRLLRLPSPQRRRLAAREPAARVPLRVDGLLQPELRELLRVEVRQRREEHVPLLDDRVPVRLHLRARLAHRDLAARLLHGGLRLSVELGRRQRLVLTPHLRVGLRRGVVVLDRGLARAEATKEGLLLRHGAHDRHLCREGGEG